MINRFLIALSFLTLLPLKPKRIDEKEIVSSVVFFPTVGFIEGILSFALSYTLVQIFPSSIISLILLLFFLIMRGILHLDGLSDTFDAFFFKSTGNREKDVKRRLEIMKDSSVGVAGVVVLVFAILCKFILFKEILELKQYLIFIFTFCLSRWIIIPLMYSGKPAKTTGLGFLFIGKIKLRQLFLSTLLPLILFLYFVVYEKYVFLVASLLLIFLIFLFLKKVFEKLFNGITGDNLGATVEIMEIAFLISFIFFERIWLSI
ncbi:MAG: adenosylcobinamide-GDP ribazoletransferase [Thermodesulfovibrio sp.]|nr:adenosylcobinamide-GDP ribazoletransferase [Thermodesulfovibrio sp.]MCX7723895.1 adenosylcobinamide-GDP ribazoletransferase [Thermodesulfovibrio sp.]MDW7971937.1 adenosylcobinamide-GDP ribazoletransferase [Thermodesulfovibrio sp.]